MSPYLVYFSSCPLNWEQLVCCTCNNLSRMQLWPQSVDSLLVCLDIHRWSSLVLCLQIVRLFFPHLVCHLVAVFWYTQCMGVFCRSSFVLKILNFFESETGLELKYSKALLRRHTINLSSFCFLDHLYGDKMWFNYVKKLVYSHSLYKMSKSLASLLTIFFLYTNALPTCQLLWFFVLELFNFYF